MAELNRRSTSAPNSGTRSTKAGKVDLTAMVDLAFLLITFFMLTTSLTKPNALSLAMPNKDKGANEPLPIADRRTIHLLLGSNDEVVWYRGKPEDPMTPPQTTRLTAKGLRNVLIDLKSQIAQRNSGEDAIVLIKPMNDAPLRNVVAVLDEMSIAGISRFMVLKPLEQDIGYHSAYLRDR